tara:strand:- start:1474 stop:1599 length:126 start_codon:yes stop_codon:yes gene_type:complete
MQNDGIIEEDIIIIIIIIVEKEDDFSFDFDSSEFIVVVFRL